MGKRLAGRTVLVTGASAGIGRATALLLAGEGAEVLATGRREAALVALADECRASGGVVRTLAGDLNDRAFVERLAESGRDADVLVNNAGVLTYAPVLDITMDECEAMLRTNVLAAFHVTQAMAAYMCARGRGHIVVITSGSARTVSRLGVFYAGTKHAMSAITRGLRLELTAAGLKVTEIAPGMVDTDIRDASTHPEVAPMLASRDYPPLTSNDIAEAVLYALTCRDDCCPDLIELRPSRA